VEKEKKTSVEGKKRRHWQMRGEKVKKGKRGSAPIIRKFLIGREGET